MNDISCCFSGHRDIPYSRIPAVREQLKREILALIKRGYTEFYAGGALGFDTLAAQTVLELKEDNPGIHLHIVIPCKSQTRGWSSENVHIYNSINARADEVICLTENYFSGCMQIRNRYMVDNSSAIITYITRASGGSAYTAGYAAKKGLEIIALQ